MKTSMNFAIGHENKSLFFNDIPTKQIRPHILGVRLWDLASEIEASI